MQAAFQVANFHVYMLLWRCSSATGLTLLECGKYINVKFGTGSGQILSVMLGDTDMCIGTFC